jgi:predicted ATPase
MTLINETIERVEAAGDTFHMPELLRLKGRIHLSKPQPHLAEAETCFLQSLELSRSQGALGLELRTATDLATLLIVRGQPERGRALLEPVFMRFSEGFDTADLKATDRLLATLR